MTAGNTQRVSEWVNLGGQITPAFRVDELREKIRKREIDSWQGIHASYDEMAAAYTLDRARHAWEVYRCLKTGFYPGAAAADHPLMNPGCFLGEIETLIFLCRLIAERVYLSRAKDFSDPFRSVTYRNREEMRQVAGTAADNTFVNVVRERSRQREEDLSKLSKRISAQ